MYERQKSTAQVMIAENAVVVGDVVLAKNCGIWYGAVLRGDEGHIEVGEDTNIQDNAVLRGDDGAIVVGEGTNIQDCAVLHEETTVGRGCTIGHGAIVHGCTVGDNTLIGMGATILNGAKIGRDCIVGAGALVTGKMDAPDGSMILGSPAKVVRPLTAEEIESNREAAQWYVRAMETYLQEHSGN